MTPDWLIQIIWFVAALAVSALFYFLTEKNYQLTVWSGFGMVVFAALAVTLMIDNSLVRRKQAGVSTSNAPVTIHRFPTKLGKPSIYLNAKRAVRVFAPVSFIIVTRDVRAELVRIGVRWEGKNLLWGWRPLKEIQLTSVNGKQITAWDYRVEVPPNTESEMQDVIFQEQWASENLHELGSPTRSRLVLWARITGMGTWEQEIGQFNLTWAFPQLGETGLEATDTWDYSGGRHWTSDGRRDQHIWNR